MLDRALLLVSFVGAMRRPELAAIRVEHLETRERGLLVTLPRSKGERAGRSVAVALPYAPPSCVQRGRCGAGWRRVPLPRGRCFEGMDACSRRTASPSPTLHRHQRYRSRNLARISKRWAGKAGFDPLALGGHSLKRGALTTGMDRGVHLMRLKQLGQHKSYAVLDEYLELGDSFKGHPLSGVL